MNLHENFQNVNISLPSTAIIGTSEFDTFLENNNIMERIKNKTDEEIDIIFKEGYLCEDLTNKLLIYLENVKCPLAVRSSSLLEDSQLQPFAGIYRTYMIPNNHEDIHVRLCHLTDAIKLVYASVFLHEASSYVEKLNYSSEEEKMAVIIQDVVGSNHGGLYYPHVSGVAQSYNFYPTSYMLHSDGIATIALGLGKAVVEGKNSYRFCPMYPESQLLVQEDIIKNSQRKFYAINLSNQDFDLTNGEESTLSYLDLKHAETYGVINSMVSVIDNENNILLDGLVADGFRVLTFAGILKYKHFPLAEIVKKLLEIGDVSLGIPVEIEFAVSLDEVPTFYILQIRPLSVNTQSYAIDTDSLNKGELLLLTTQGMGNGSIENLYDIIYVKPETFDKAKTYEIQKEIELLNNELKNQKRNYILMGPGRWGTRDRFLGIPVTWNDISKAKVIVEFGLDNFMIDASQGTHFFHNLLSMNVGYFNVRHKSHTDYIDWEWLNQCEKLKDLQYSALIRFDNPLVVKMDGRNGLAAIWKS
jgi:phosphoenolpyruvate synthase/pyruvate phosphate dikinase